MCARGKLSRPWQIFFLPFIRIKFSTKEPFWHLSSSSADCCWVTSVNRRVTAGTESAPARRNRGIEEPNRGEKRGSCGWEYLLNSWNPWEFRGITGNFRGRWKEGARRHSRIERRWKDLRGKSWQDAISLLVQPFCCVALNSICCDSQYCWYMRHMYLYSQPTFSVAVGFWCKSDGGRGGESCPIVAEFGWKTLWSRRWCWSLLLRVFQCWRREVTAEIFCPNPSAWLALTYLRFTSGSQVAYFRSLLRLWSSWQGSWQAFRRARPCGRKKRDLWMQAQWTLNNIKVQLTCNFRIPV